VVAPQGEQVKLGAPVPAGSLLAPTFRFEFAIYTERAPKPSVRSEVMAAARDAGFDVARERRVLQTTAPKKTEVYFEQPAIADYAAPPLEVLEVAGDGLSDDEKKRLAACSAVAVFAVIGPSARAREDYRHALELALGLAKKLGGFLWDQETGEAFTTETWKERLTGWHEGVPDVTSHVALHQYKERESDQLLRLVSRGMVKLGLPDVSVNGVAAPHAPPMANAVNVALQQLVEAHSLPTAGQLRLSLDELQHRTVREEYLKDLKNNAKRRVDVSLVESERHPDDADNRLLELGFPGDVLELHVRHSAMTDALFGSEDSLVHVTHDQELMEASRRARAKAFTYRERFAKGAPEGESLSVKVPFRTPSGGDEWMWVVVLTWKGNVITGILDNDPFEIPTLKSGARVEVQADQIFDYTLQRQDGSVEGNTTGALIEKQTK
jgi:uncharacterized protein YegJ (DUF2314 family)